MFDIIKTDYARSTKRKWSIVNYLLLCFSSKGVAAVKDYRFSNWLYRKKLFVPAKMVQNRNIKKHGCDIGCNAQINEGFAIGHPVGIVITGEAIIGKNCTIMSNVTIGAKEGRNEGTPIIKDQVYIGTGAKILGKCIIEDNAIIGANAVVLKNIVENKRAVGVPAREM